MAEGGKVYPNCVNTSNAYHECGAYCRLIAESVEDTWLKGYAKNDETTLLQYDGSYDLEKVQEVAALEHRLALDELRAKVITIESKLDQTLNVLKEIPIELRVEGTWLKAIDHNTKKVQEVGADHALRLENQQLTLDELVAKVAAVDIKLDQTLNQLKERPIQLPSPDSHFGSIGGSICLDFPRFNGDDPAGWIFKAENYFKYYSVPDDKRLLIASIHMDDQALQWFMLMSRCEEMLSWDQFAQALETRFGPSEFGDHQGALLKLVQTSSVDHYLARFQALANRTAFSGSTFEMDCFISGLRSDIKAEVLARRPTTISQAMVLARQQEAKLNYQLQQQWLKWNYSPATTSAFSYGGLPSNPFSSSQNK